MTTKRITPEQVKAAYDNTGIKPRKGTAFGNRKDQSRVGGLCCCGLAVLFFDAHPETLMRIEMELDTKPACDNVSDVYQWARAEYGEDYMSGFMGGFDCFTAEYEFSSERMRQGHEDGRAAAALVNPY